MKKIFENNYTTFYDLNIFVDEFFFHLDIEYLNVILQVAINFQHHFSLFNMVEIFKADVDFLRINYVKSDFYKNLGLKSRENLWVTCKIISVEECLIIN